MDFLARRQGPKVRSCLAPSASPVKLRAHRTTLIRAGKKNRAREDQAYKLAGPEGFYS
jgi:hypothetical protein